MTKSIIAKKRIKQRGILNMLLAVFFSYIMIIPIVFFDVMLEIYHRVCFFIYKIPYVKRSSYISFDRAKLNYLSFGDKINCIYCEYANGFIYYAYTIISETEKYWCPIKYENKKSKNLISPPHHKNFVEFGDKESLRRYIKNN